MSGYKAQAWEGDPIFDAPPILPLGFKDARADNGSRAARAAQAAKTYAVICYYGSEETQTILGDLLCDLMHLCDVAGIDFDECIWNGRMHYTAEFSGEDYYTREKAK